MSQPAHRDDDRARSPSLVWEARLARDEHAESVADQTARGAEPVGLAPEARRPVGTRCRERGPPAAREHLHVEELPRLTGLASPEPSVEAHLLTVHNAVSGRSERGHR